MNKTRVGGIAAGTFAVGLLTGLAGTAVARDGAAGLDCTAVMAEHMNVQGMTGMSSMMSSSTMGGSMMGGPNAFACHDTMGPDAGSMSGNQHQLHHPAATPEPSK
jgi:hypothetical protein